MDREAGGDAAWQGTPRDTLPPASSPSHPTLAGAAHCSLLAGGLGIALDLVQTNAAAGPTWMWHGLMALPKEDTTQETDWRRWLQENLVQRLLQLLARSSAPVTAQSARYCGSHPGLSFLAHG